MARLAILAGKGALPQIIARSHPDALFVYFEAVPVELPSNDRFQASFERIGELFAGLKEAGVTELVFAGGLDRPDLDSGRFDSRMRELAPRISAAIQSGDDELLRIVAGLFEQEGFSIRGAHELVAGLTAEPGLLAGPAPSAADRGDAQRAYMIVSALGALDVGQGAVVAGGQVLGIETAQGTDAMLRFVAETSPKLRPGAKGVLVKASKPGQDLRFDMPAIGPDTISTAARAGLAGIVVESGKVLLLERARILHAAKESDLFLLAEKF